MSLCHKELDHHWFKLWLGNCSAPSHHQNQCEPKTITRDYSAYAPTNERRRNSISHWPDAHTEWSLHDTIWCHQASRICMSHMITDNINLHIHIYQCMSVQESFTQDVWRWKGLYKRTILYFSWASCQIHKNAGCTCAGNCGSVFPVSAGLWSWHASRHVWRTCRDTCRDC